MNCVKCEEKLEILIFKHIAMCEECIFIMVSTPYADFLAQAQKVDNDNVRKAKKRNKLCLKKFSV